MIHFVYRSHYAGPLSRRVVALDAPTVLDWFRTALAEARVSDDPGQLAIQKLGGYVYGFETLFQAAKRLALPPPSSTEDLRRMLHAHLYVEGGPDAIRVDDLSVRVCTDDDEVQLAYFFIDEEAIRLKPERAAWLLVEDPNLPEGDAEGKFKSPVSVGALESKDVPKGAGTTYACFFTFYDSESIPGSVHAFPGVRLPGLASYLRTVTPGGNWPIEATVLRAMVDAEDETIGPALERSSRFPVVAIQSKAEAGAVAWKDARAALVAAAGGRDTHTANPEKSILHANEHVAVGCMHVSKAFGFQQWVLFDDTWAVKNPALAASILRYATCWDPFVGTKATAKPAKLVKLEAEATALERRWADALGENTEVQPYAPTNKLAPGDVLDHAKFGRGAVVGIDGGKARILFRDGEKTLLHEGN